MIPITTIIAAGLALGAVARRLSAAKISRTDHRALALLGALFMAILLITALLAPGAGPLVLSSWLAVASIAALVFFTREQR